MPAEEEKPPVQPPDKPEPVVPVEVEKHEEAHRNPVRKPGQAKDQLTLKQILGELNDHIDEVVSPTDLILVGSQVVDRMGLANGLEVRSAGALYQTFLKPGTDFEIVLKPELAAHLRQEINRNIIVRGDYPAMLGMKIVKTPGGTGYRGVVEWLEFLYYLDARFLEGGAHLNKALFVLNLTPEGGVLRHSQRHKEWEVRLRPTHIIPNVRNLYIKEGRPLGYGDLAVKATRPDRISSAFFHNWIRAHIH